MEADSFFSRWSKRKHEARQQEEVQPPAPATASVPAAPAPAVPLPTMADVAGLTSDSDFKPFLARGVEEAVKRSAMKKLFADPHFNIMDGLDVYIDDYSKFEPIPPEMLAQLNHAKALLDPLAHLENPLQVLLDTSSLEVASDTEPGVESAAGTETEAGQTDIANDNPPSDPDQGSHDDPI